MVLFIGFVSLNFKQLSVCISVQYSVLHQEIG